MDKCLNQIKSKIQQLRNLKKENFLVAIYDINKRLITSEFIGSDRYKNSCTVSIRILAKLLVNNDNSCYLYVLHNHPDQCSAPSYQDMVLTNTIWSLCDILSIGFADHIIVSKGYQDFSFDNSSVTFPVTDIENSTKDIISEYMTANNNEALNLFCKNKNTL